MEQRGIDKYRGERARRDRRHSAQPKSATRETAQGEECRRMKTIKMARGSPVSDQSNR
jgi:hypothetical protein